MKGRMGFPLGFCVDVCVSYFAFARVLWVARWREIGLL